MIHVSRDFLGSGQTCHELHRFLMQGTCSFSIVDYDGLINGLRWYFAFCTVLYASDRVVAFSAFKTPDGESFYVT